MKLFYYTISGTKLRLRLYFLGFRLASIPLKKRVRSKLERLEVQQGKVVFTNFLGKGYGCNPKYITEALRTWQGLSAADEVSQEPSTEGRSQFDLVWLVNNASNEQANFPEGVRLVEAGSMQALQELASAQVWVSNCRLGDYYSGGLKKKENQTYIQTWHGLLGIKKVEAGAQEHLSEAYFKGALLDSACIDYFISPSAFDTKIIKSDFWYHKEILEVGYPRNDLLIAAGEAEQGEGSSSSQQQALVIKQRLGLEAEVGVLLYAPTFRDGSDSVAAYAQLDLERLLGALEDKWQRKFVCLLRFHPNICQQSQAFAAQHGFHDVTFYPDMTELLLISDVLVTDYSSCIFDFSLMQRPAFMVIFDEQAYAEERGFYLKLTDLPFPLARSNDELCQKVAAFDGDRYRAQVSAFQAQQGYYLKSDAAQRCAELIASLCAHDPSQSSAFLDLEDGYRYLKRYLYAARAVVSTNASAEATHHQVASDHSPSDVPTSAEPLRIWQMWWQGAEQAPEFVKRCMASVRHYYGEQVTVLTQDNYRQYVTIPDYVMAKFEQGKISFAAFSDIVRCLLLCEHGGLWVDATCLLTAPIPQAVLDQEVFYFKSVTWSLSPQVPNERMLELLVRIPTYLGAIHSGSSWFLRAKAGSQLMLLLRAMILEYWRNEDKPVDYYWFHLMLTVLIVNLPEARHCYEQMLTLNNRNPHILLTCLEHDFNQSAFEQIKAFSFVHKLTYKDLERAQHNPKSYLNHLLSATDLS